MKLTQRAVERDVENVLCFKRGGRTMEMHRSKTKGETNYLNRFFGLVFAGSFASLISV